MTGTYEPVYRASGGASTTPLPGASPAAFGAAVGEGLGELGAAGDRALITDHELDVRRQRETQSADAGVRMAKIGAAIEDQVQNLRDKAPPGAAGHTAAVNQAIAQYEPEMFAGITNHHVLDAYRPEWQALAERVSTREYGWEAGRRVEHDTNNVQDQTVALAAPQEIAPDVHAWSQGLDQIATNWNNLNVGDDVRERGIRENQRELTLAYARGLVRTDHAAFTRQAGTLAQFGHLTPEDMNHLEEGAEVEQRRDEALTRAHAAEARSEAEQTYVLYHTRLTNGEELSPAEFDAYDHAAAASGQPAHVYDAQVARIRQGINRETSAWTPNDWETNINTLQAMPHRTPEQDIRLDQLRQIRSARVTEFNADPQGAAARGGNLAPPIADIEHVAPAERDARVAWARGFRQAHNLGATPYLGANEMHAYRQQLDTGGDGAMLEVAQSLRGNWGVGVGTEIARQFDHHGPELSLMIGLPDASLRMYGLGRQALSRNPALFDRNQARDIFLENQDAIPPQFRDAVFKASRNIAAGMLDTNGDAAFDPDVYRMALHRALGASGSPGNLAGGIGIYNGAHIWLPPSISQAEFERRISTAAGPQWERASVNERGEPTMNGPRYVGADGRPGRPLFTAEARAAHFVTISPGIYTIPGAVDARGRPWRFDIRRLPGR